MYGWLIYGQLELPLARWFSEYGIGFALGNNKEFKMQKLLLLPIALMALGLTACSSLTAPAASNQSEPAYADMSGVPLGSCTWEGGHTSRDGRSIEDGYRCAGGLSEVTPPANGSCTWVTGYFRTNGNYTSGHYRCSSQASLQVNQSSQQAPVAAPKPAATTTRGSNCHTVRGYYRKNGTYVRGHTRCR